MDLAKPASLIAASSPVAAGDTAAKPAGGNSKLAASARQFGAMFMTEMVRLARPENKAVGAFKSGTGERSWQIFMDQALGQAAAGQDASSLVGQIQQALQRAEDGNPAVRAAAPAMPADPRVTNPAVAS